LGYSTSWLSDVINKIKQSLIFSTPFFISRLKMSWFEVFRMSASTFKVATITKFLESFLKFYDLMGLNRVLELNIVEKLNAAILKVCPNYLFDDLMLIYLIENSDFNYENFITNSILNKLKLRVKKADAAIKVEFKGLKLSVLKLNIPELKAKVVTSNSKQSSNKNLKVATLNKFFVLPFNVKKKLN